MTVRELLLRRRGLVFLPAETCSDRPIEERLLQAVEVELAGLGYAVSTRLRQRFSCLPLPELVQTQRFVVKALAAALGADRKHEPLFRRFPDGVPEETFDLWLKKVLSHFFQAKDEPCLFCQKVGTTHVLRPCRHVVCDRCFDGSNYSACPVCEHQVDRDSPFFQPAPVPRGAPREEHVAFKLLDLGADPQEEARRLFLSLCERKQALSPDDLDVLTTLLGELGGTVLGWLPEKIPLKENIAAIFGTLLRHGDSATILARALPYLATATDVLRLIAAFSYADPSLQPKAVPQVVRNERQVYRRWHGRFVESLAKLPKGTEIKFKLTVRRFRMAKMRRPLRRGLLSILEGLVFERLMEDMLRHRSYWVWVGKFLHPFEYAGSFPRVALAFSVLRKTRPGDDALARSLRAAPEWAALEQCGRRLVFRNYHARLERAARAGDSAGFTRLLAERPGELARRLDHALRLALSQGTSASTAATVQAFVERVQRFSTPVLVTLSSLLATRTRPSPVRIYWPKGQVAKGVSEPDRRQPIPWEVLRPLVLSVQGELVRRFAEKPALRDFVIDTALGSVVVPFNERTASRSAVALPRGSRLALPEGKLLRLFLHWCQPEGGMQTDIDLSIGFYDEKWALCGTCAYYALRFSGKKVRDIAQSSGDRRNAPPPDGATEFVDLHRDRAREEGIRYAVMVVNNYAGLPFSKLERGFAGIMLRGSDEGAHFDPRLVALKFALQGENGVYLPMVVDLQDGVLHWLDVYSKGGLAFNNVATSNKDIQRRCPELMAYFASGVRPAMFDLALLHAAGRADHVYLRGVTVQRYSLRPGEDRAAFHQRIMTEAPDQTLEELPSFAGPIGAALYRGDIDVPEGSTCYALFRERVTDVIAASDLLSG